MSDTTIHEVVRERYGSIASTEGASCCVTGAIDADIYTGLMREAGFVDIQVVDKANAEDIVPRQPGMPRIYSARISAYKPS